MEGQTFGLDRCITVMWIEMRLIWDPSVHLIVP
jgi:hypothetical protein